MNNNICTKCGLCVRVCGKAITLGEKGPEIDLSRCNGCGHCASVCPTGAIENPKAPLLREVYIPSYEEATTFLRSSRSVRFFKDETVKEVILATNPTIEGEATAMYIARLIKPAGIKVSQLAHGIPVGMDLEYADEMTLYKAVEGRREYKV